MVAPGSVSWPDKMRSNASRCASVARSSTITRSLAPAFMDGTRPAKDSSKSYTVKFSVAVIALVDLHAYHRLAEPVCRQRVELARAAIGTIAIRELPCLYHPLQGQTLRITS